jgi:hypothetical protein
MRILKIVDVNGLKLHQVQLTSNLYLHDYIPFSLYKRYVTPGDKYFGWNEKYIELLCRKIDIKLVESDQKLTDKFGAVTINNWFTGGQFNNRGLRLCGSSVGAELSDHFQGRASDKTFRDYTADQVRDYIKSNWLTLGITIIEDNVTWVHTSVAWVPNQTQLKIVQP